jgi:RND family efflux transporter MFP subunit
MKSSTNKYPDISKLKIDRNPPINNVWHRANITNVLILLMISASVYYLSMGIFNSADDTANNPNSRITDITDSKHTLVSETVIVSNKVETASRGKNQGQKTILDASGHIVARRIATVSSRVTGKLNQLNIEEGQKVKKSEILAELDNKQAKLSYQLALADLLANQAQFEELTLLFNQQTKRYNRNKSLAKKQLISEQMLEDNQFKNEQLAIQVKNKKALVNLAEQRVALAQYQLNQHQIRAPFDGVVISKNAQVGELISAGSSGGGFIRTGVGTIVDMSSLEIEVEVGESYINRVFAGQKVIAKLDAYPQWKINSEVVAVIPTADRQKASIKVRVKLFELDPRILPDMSVKVSFIDKVTNNNKSSQQSRVAAL